MKGKKLNSDNPASRLLKILETGKKHKPGIKCRDVWHNILNVDTSNSALLMSRLGKVMELPELIILEIQDKYPNQKSTHNHWSTKVNTAFMQQNLNGQWQEFIQHIDSHTTDYLSMSADLLEMKSDTQILSESEISDIRKKIDDLLLEVIDSDIDIKFKDYIVSYLRKILVAIDEYNISGATPISECIESTFGHAFIDEKYRTNISNTDIGNKVVSVLSAVASVVTIAVGLPQLPNTFQLLLTNTK